MLPQLKHHYNRAFGWVNKVLGGGGTKTATKPVVAKKYSKSDFEKLVVNHSNDMVLKWKILTGKDVCRHTVANTLMNTFFKD